MRSIGQILLLALLPTCAFTPREQALVSDARRLGTQAVGDPLFREVVLELADAGEVDWSDGRYDGFPDEGQTAPDRWVLQQFAAKGLFSADSIQPWATWWAPRSKTTASTNACGPAVRLNVLRLRRSEYSVANTLVHERVHSFCQIHPLSQERPPNVCDAAYVYGDLAEMIARHRQAAGRIDPDEPVCPALCTALQRRGIVGRCPGGGTAAAEMDVGETRRHGESAALPTG